MSGFLDAFGKIKGGTAAKKQAFSEAKQMEDKAGLTRAISQREGIEERRQADLLQSRALAVAAASGGGVSDPTVINIIAGLEEEGLVRSLNAMASGETEAKFLERQAGMKREYGKSAMTAALIGAASSIAGQSESLIAGQSEALKAKYG